MRGILIGGSPPYRLVDPNGLGEADFALAVTEALPRLHAGTRCIPFTGHFEYEGVRRKPDLALVAKDLSHWFVVEVELTCHSFGGHVLPQVRAFRYGTPQPDCARILARHLGIELGQAESLIAFVPRSVVVVAEARKAEWEHALGALDVQYVTVTPYEAEGRPLALAVEGALYVTKESLGIGTYSVTDRALRMARSTLLEDGRFQIEDAAGVVSWWLAERTGESLWITKESGGCDIDNCAHVQLIRTAAGRLSMRELG